MKDEGNPSVLKQLAALIPILLSYSDGQEISAMVETLRMKSA
jgi:hypothetical protein